MRQEFAKGYIDAHNKMKQDRAKFATFLLTFAGISAIMVLLFAK